MGINNDVGSGFRADDVLQYIPRQGRRRRKGREERRKGPTDNSNPNSRRVAKKKRLSGLKKDKESVDVMNVDEDKEASHIEDNVDDDEESGRCVTDEDILQVDRLNLGDIGNDGDSPIDESPLDKGNDWERTISRIVCHVVGENTCFSFFDTGSNYMWDRSVSGKVSDCDKDGDDCRWGQATGDGKVVEEGGGGPVLEDSLGGVGEDNGDGRAVENVGEGRVGENDGDGRLSATIDEEDERESIVDGDDDVGSSEGGGVDCGKACRSRPRRGMKPSAVVKEKGFVVEVIPRCNPNLKAKLWRYVCTVGAVVTDDARLKPNEETQEDVVKLKVGSHCASVVHCYSVASSMAGGVHENYVRAVSVLYSKWWKRKYGENLLRYMVDPSYAFRIRQEIGPPSGWNDYKTLSKYYAKEVAINSAQRIQVVFVPILEVDHWWCVSFCANTEEVWVIDSVDRSPMEIHDHSLWQLCFAMDMLFGAIGLFWNPGKILSWKRKAVTNEAESDGASSGVFMLLEIKACADRYKTDFILPSGIDLERGWLLKDDLMDDENEAKPVVKQLLHDYQF